MKNLILRSLVLLLFVSTAAKCVETTTKHYQEDGYDAIYGRVETEDYRYEDTDIPQTLRHAPNQIIVKFRQAVADTVEQQVNTKILPKQLKLSSNLDQLNAKHRIKSVKPLFKDFKKHRQDLKALQTKNKSLLTKKEKRILRRLKRAPKNAKVPSLDRIYKLELDLEEGQALEDVVAAYNNDHDVEYAELNYIVSINKTPNDPLYPVQWALENTGQIYPESGSYNSPPGTPDADIDAPEAWDAVTGSPGIVVAVIDSGVDYNHRDLQGNMWTNSSGHYGYDYVNDDTDPIDDNGHGTHCAGIITAKGDNGLDVAGVCWNVKIMALKCLNASGNGNTDDATEAFYYAVDNGADVTSNSWGGGGYSQSMQDAINYAHSQGVIMVAAAGNENSSTLHYPAAFDNMISVAATNSNDERATFSTFGDWVDIAAPGVDILSLLATGVTKGTPYDDYTTIMSGTSMACPYVSGACALLLSLNPYLDIDLLEQILLDTAETIDPGVCRSGRLNLYKALLEISTSEGRVVLNQDLYSCSDILEIHLMDFDLSGNGTHQVNVETDAGDFETVSLTETDYALGAFIGTISTGSGNPNIGDSIVQVSHNQIITVTYQDANDGTGNPAIVTDTATADCEPPVVFNIQIDPAGPEPQITFDTNEPATVRVLCGTTCGGPYIIDVNNPGLATSHAIRLPGVSPETDYYFIIEANDVVYNQAIDDNYGSCYTFTTDSGPRDIYVPSDALTIQEAIDISWNGGTVLVADGTYTGQGNRDIDFLGRAITLKSENGPQNCIIDCNGSETDLHNGFNFQNDEDSNSVLDGFTITSGYNKYGGGIYCGIDESPTISNCVITGNSADYGGGVHGGDGPITNCIISNNKALKAGGGLIVYHGPIRYCKIIGNWAKYDGGGIYNCDLEINHCIIAGNIAENYDGGGIYSSYAHIANCVIADNQAGDRGGAIMRYYGGPITNCIIWGNQSPETTVYQSAVPLYSCVQNDSNGIGCISADPDFVAAGSWNNNGTPVDANDDFWVDGDYRLQSGSPCIDTGNYAYSMYLPIIDYDGNTRLAGSQIDMGCFEFGSSPDTDGDLLSDADETLYGTNPNIIDTDSDGISDGKEILLGTDPLIPDSQRSWQVPSDASSIQQALFFSRSGEKIVVSEGTYYESIFIGGRNITLTSTNPQDPDVVEATIINADIDADPNTFNGRVVAFTGSEDETCQISGLTIKGGTTNGAGGGIRGGGLGGAHSDGTYATISNCNIIENISNRRGGGLCNCHGLITNCTISNNYGHSGGGLINCDGTIKNCIISDNTSTEGGGLMHCDGTITDCVISGNSTRRGGGGLLECNGTISNCIISSNHANLKGGGLRVCPTTINNCIFIGNSADEDGGAAHFFGYSAAFNNCTFAENSAPYGRAISCNSVPFYWPSDLTVRNCIFANDGNEIYNNDDSTIDITYSNVYGGYPGQGNIDADPCFVDPINSDYHLLENSLCINTGDPNYIPEPSETDLDGNPRIMGGRIDMGAYEFIEDVLNTRPIADAGPDQTIECNCNTPQKTVVTLDGTASFDPDDDPITFTWTGPFDESPAQGSAPTVTLSDGCPGDYVITLIVNDGATDSLPDEVTITVEDTTPPNINCPSDITLEATGPDGAVVTFTVTAADLCDPSPDMILNPPSGSTFPIGTTEVLCAATDDSGNTSSCTFIVTVQDTIPPVINCPEDITLEATGPDGAVATFTVTAADLCDPSPDIILNPPSGSTFPIGTTEVLCAATDSSSNTSDCSFTITVTRSSSNTAPLANAGPNQTVYASSDGLADVTLDGSASYDNNGDPLTYLWGWTIGLAQVVHEANGVNPTIELPVGEHTIYLIVNDGINDSEPDETIITVLPAIEPAIEVDMKFTPQTLNCKSKGNWVKAHITLAEGFSANDVSDDPITITNSSVVIIIESHHVNVFINDDGLVEIEAAFSRRDFCEAFSSYSSGEIAAFGTLTTGQTFFGTDTILIIDNRFQQLAAFASQWLQTDCGPPDWCNGQDLDHNKAVNFVDFSMF